MRAPSQNLRDQWLAVLLEQLKTGQGWTARDAERAALQAGLSPGEQALAAPGGVTDLLDHFFDDTEAALRQAAEDRDLSDLRTHERVAELILLWLDLLEPNRAAVSKAVAYGLRPWRAGPGLRRLWSVADCVWDLAGDTASDYNRYSKRGLLSATLPAILFYWLEQPTRPDLDSFIERQLKRAMQIGKSGANIVQPFINYTESNTKKD